jgi:hypothetical protein
VKNKKNALLDYNDVIDLATNLLGNPDYKDWVLFNLRATSPDVSPEVCSDIKARLLFILKRLNENGS